MMNFYINIFNACLTAAGYRANTPTPFAILAVRRDKPPGQNMAVYIESKEFS